MSYKSFLCALINLIFQYRICDPTVSYTMKTSSPNSKLHQQHEVASRANKITATDHNHNLMDCFLSKDLTPFRFGCDEVRIRCCWYASLFTRSQTNRFLVVYSSNMWNCGTPFFLKLTFTAAVQLLIVWAQDVAVTVLETNCRYSLRDMSQVWLITIYLELVPNLCMLSSFMCLITFAATSPYCKSASARNWFWKSTFDGYQYGFQLDVSHPYFPQKLGN